MFNLHLNVLFIIIALLLASCQKDKSISSSNTIPPASTKDDSNKHTDSLQATPPEVKPFIITVQTLIQNAEVSIIVHHPTQEDITAGRTNAYTLDCGNGDPVIDGQSGNILCTYQNPGQYSISISGKLIGIKLTEKQVQWDYQYRFIDLKQWGSIEWVDLTEFAYNCFKLNISASDAPNLRNTRSLERLFSYSTINIPLNHWDVSNVKNMKSVFEGNHDFNQPLDQWDVSHVEDMSGMFDSATSFNQPINKWNVSNVKNMKKMFYNAEKFNQPLDQWNVSKVSNMKCMFNYANSFKQDISTWDFSAIDSCLRDNPDNECIEFIFSYSEKDKSNLNRYGFIDKRFPNGYVFSNQDDADGSICE